jgi:FkbM family methyltransferase
LGLCNEIEVRTASSDWKEGILKNITPEMGISPFSEYETIANYALARFADESPLIPQVNPNDWSRDGYTVIGPAANLELFGHKLFEAAAFVSFERWQSPYSYYQVSLRPAVSSPSANCMRLSTRVKFFLAAMLKALKLDIRAAYLTAQQAFLVPAVPAESAPAESEDEKIKRFLTDFFRSAPTATVLQIGANDGVMNDPLRPFLPTHQGQIVLVEALPHYCASLRQLYRDQKNVNIAALLVASREEERDFYYIRPAVADLMDGDGPPNRWAHGQGSFSKSTVVDWIVKNQFRGQSYRQNLQMFIDSIECYRLASVTLSSLVNTYQLGQIDLVVLDVQGAEYEILSSLKGIEKYPRFIIYEDDSSLSDQDRSGLESMLTTMGYVFIAGNSDRLWGLDLVGLPRSSLGF